MCLMEHWFVLDESHYFKDNYSSFFPLSHKSDAGPFNSYLFCQEEEYRAKSSRPYFGKTPTEVSKGFVRVRTAWFVSQFLLIIWSMIANTRAPHRVWRYRGTVADSVIFFVTIVKISVMRLWKIPFSPNDLGIRWAALGFWRLLLWN